MDTNEPTILELDATYKAVPSFSEWLQRTTIETQRWNRSVAELESARKTSGQFLDRALEVAKRASAFDTGAIEGLYETDRGFTFTVAQEAAAWETALEAKGAQVRSLFDAQLKAYDLVLDIATKSEPLSEAAIRHLHEVVCAAQDTYRVATPQGFQEQALPKGQYKSLPNHVRTRKGDIHAYAPVDITAEEMHRLVSELRSDAFLSAHPIIQAAYAHYCFVAIHPFADGNGRVARAIASVYTYRSSSTPLMIWSEQKVAYLDALESADAGNFNAFVHFLLFRALDTFDLVIESFQAARAPQQSSFAAGITALYQTRGGFSHEKVDETGKAFVAMFSEEMTKQISEIGVANVSGQVQRSFTSAGSSLPPTHRTVLQGTFYKVQIALRTAPPIDAGVRTELTLALPKDASGEDDVLLISGKERISARMDELVPVVSGVLILKIKLVAERIIAEMKDELLKVAATKAAQRFR